MLSRKVEHALSICGTSRVFINSSTPTPQIAIRWEPEVVGASERWIREEGSTLDDAGTKAATEFARRVRERGQELVAWAARIEKAMAT